MSDQMVYYIELKGKFDDLERSLDQLYKKIQDNSAKSQKTTIHPPIEEYNKYIEAKKKLDEKSYKDYAEFQKLKTIKEELENNKALQNYIEFVNKEAAYSKKANQSLVGDYKDFKEAKKKLDNKSQMTFGEYEKAKTTVENAENDKRLKSYIDYRNSEDERSKKSLENMKKLGTALTLGVTAPITAMAVMSIRSAGQMEKYTATLRTMLGSEEAAFKRMEEYKRIAASTPFELKQVVDAGNQLQALNKYSEETIINLGDLAAASGKPLEQVMNAYAKLVTGQKGEAINMFRDMLIAQSDWVDANGKALETTEEMLAELPEILERKSFVGMMDEQSKTFEGQMSNLKDSITNLGASFGEILLPTVKTVVSALTSAVDGFKNLDDGTKKIIIGIAGVAAIAGPTILGITGIIKTYNTLSAALSTATAKQLLQNAAVLANPYVLVGAAIVATTAFLAYYYVKSNDVNTITNKLSDSTEKLKKYSTEYKDVVNQLSSETANLTKEEEANLLAKKALLQLDIQESIDDAIKAYKKLGAAKKEELEEDRKDKKADYDYIIELMTDANKRAAYFKENMDFDINAAPEKEKAAAISLLSEMLGDASKKYQEINSKIVNYEAATTSFIDELARARIGNPEFEGFILQLKQTPELYDLTINKIAELEAAITATSSGAPPVPPSPPVGNLEDIKALYEEYIKLEKNLKDNRYANTVEGAQKRLAEEKRLTELNNNELLRSYIEINKAKEKADKDAFEKKKSDYDKYVDNIKKLESGLLSDTEKAAYESENRKLQANYEAYKAYLEKQKEIEKKYIASPERLSEYIALKNQLYDGDFENLQEYNDLEKKEEDIKNDYKIESYIEYLKNKKFLTEEEKKAFLELKEYEKKLEDDAKKAAAEAEAAKEKAKKDDYSELISGIGAYADSIITNFELISNATDINYAKIANTIGSINKSFLSVSDGINSAISTYSDFSERIEKEADSTERSNLKIAQTVSLIGDAATMAFEAVSQVITAISQAFAQETERQLAIVEQNYQDTLKSINDTLTAESEIVEEQKQKRLQALKDEMAERGIIIETGYETELEKAQEAHQEALDELNEFQDDENEKRLDYLEAYRESLVGRTDAEIEEALRQKENELKREREQKELNLRTVADERAAEVEKQKILEDSKKKQLELEYNAEAAKVQAENEAEANKHTVEVDAFEKQKGLQIAMAWINLAAGTVGAFAQGIAQLGPVVGSIVGAAASTLLTGVTVAQTVAIASQAPPAAPIPKALPTPPKFASGGIIPGNSVIGDNIDIKANAGEMILNRDQQQSLFNMINDGTLGLGGNQNVNVTVVCYIDSSQIPIKQKLIEIQRDEAFRR